MSKVTLFWIIIALAICFVIFFFFFTAFLFYQYGRQKGMKREKQSKAVVQMTARPSKNTAVGALSIHSATRSGSINNIMPDIRNTLDNKNQMHLITPSGDINMDVKENKDDKLEMSDPTNDNDGDDHEDLYIQNEGEGTTGGN